MKDKKKIFVRILCGILVVIMTLGLIIPYVSASELEGEVGTDVTSDQLPDGWMQEWQEEVDLESIEFDIPFDALPDGFEYRLLENNTWELRKEDNGNTGFIISGLPENYDCSTVTVFIGNLETEEIFTLDLKAENYYIGQLSLWDGYYVIFPNNYSFCGTNGVGYSIRGGKNLYFHVGSEFDSEKYPVEFLKVEDNTELFNLTLLKAPENFNKVGATTTLNVDSTKIELPEDVRIEALQQYPSEDQGEADPESPMEPVDQTTPTEPVDQTTPTEPITPPEEEEKNTLLAILFEMLKNSWLIISVIVICFIGTLIIKTKKKKELEKQMENDQYDDHRIE